MDIPVHERGDVIIVQLLEQHNADLQQAVRVKWCLRGNIQHQATAEARLHGLGSAGAMDQHGQLIRGWCIQQVAASSN